MTTERERQRVAKVRERDESVAGAARGIETFRRDVRANSAGERAAAGLEARGEVPQWHWRTIEAAVGELGPALQALLGQATAEIPCVKDFANKTLESFLKTSRRRGTRRPPRTGSGEQRRTETTETETMEQARAIVLTQTLVMCAHHLEFEGVTPTPCDLDGAELEHLGPVGAAGAPPWPDPAADRSLAARLERATRPAIAARISREGIPFLDDARKLVRREYRRTAHPYGVALPVNRAAIVAAGFLLSGRDPDERHRALAEIIRRDPFYTTETAARALHAAWAKTHAAAPAVGRGDAPIRLREPFDDLGALAWSYRGEEAEPPTTWPHDVRELDWMGEGGARAVPVTEMPAFSMHTWNSVGSRILPGRQTEAGAASIPGPDTDEITRDAGAAVWAPWIGNDEVRSELSEMVMARVLARVRDAEWTEGEARIVFPALAELNGFMVKALRWVRSDLPRRYADTDPARFTPVPQKPGEQLREDFHALCRSLNRLMRTPEFGSAAVAALAGGARLPGGTPEGKFETMTAFIEWLGTADAQKLPTKGVTAVLDLGEKKTAPRTLLHVAAREWSGMTWPEKTDRTHRTYAATLTAAIVGALRALAQCNPDLVEDALLPARPGPGATVPEEPLEGDAAEGTP
ncbi:MAG TPA: hypothetical protein VFC82_02400 [Actinomycetaceae bacterium]|nr:hypothetical protein [Actinomycetaceae bacterium]